MPSRVHAALAGLALLTLAACSGGDGVAAPSAASSATPAPAVTPAGTHAPAATPAPTVTVTAPATPTPTPTPTEASPAPSDSAVVRGGCSSSEVPGDLPDAGVTDTVAATREALFLAALACDYDALGAVAGANPQGFSYSFGAEGDPADHWREAEERGERVLFALATLLRLEPREQTEADGGDYVVWPAAFVKNATDADWQEVVDSGLYSQVEADELRALGIGYSGWRSGIDAEGNWDFFIAGD